MFSMAWSYLLFKILPQDFSTCNQSLSIAQTSGCTGFKATRAPATPSNVDFEPKNLEGGRHSLIFHSAKIKSTSTCSAMTPVAHDDKISRHSKKEKKNEPEGFRHDLNMIQGMSDEES